MMTPKQMSDRIESELLACGLPKRELQKAESKYLTQIIHEDEHIIGAVGGMYDDSLHAMLVATDKRIFFLDCKPMYTVSDELTYEVVSGVKHSHHGPVTRVTLHSRVSDYSLVLTNKNAADNFVRAVETRRLETNVLNQDDKEKPKSEMNPKLVLDDAVVAFLQSRELGVLSTVDRTGVVAGAAVYYVLASDGCVYLMSRSNTLKLHNAVETHMVALTVYDEKILQTVQLQGHAEIEIDDKKREMIFERLMRPRPVEGTVSLPPITKQHSGTPMILRIDPFAAKFTNFLEK